MATDAGAPYFSVVIPVYNRSDQARSALESVRTQTFPHFECIVVDDGSADGHELAAVVSSLCDSRFVYIRQENQGACSARNRGIDRAQGRYLALLDSDDTFMPEKLEKNARIIEEHDGDLLLYSQLLVERGLQKVWIRPPRGLLADERVDEYLFCTPGQMMTSTMVLPTEVARKVRFDESLTSLQDSDFAIRAAGTGIKIWYIAEPLIVYEDTPSERRVSRSNKYIAILEWLDRMRGHELSDRAYWACRGWHCARIASFSNRPYGIRLFLESAVRGVFPFRQSFVVVAQVLIPQRHYQAIANFVVRLRGHAKNDRNSTDKASNVH